MAICLDMRVVVPRGMMASNWAHNMVSPMVVALAQSRKAQLELPGSILSGVVAVVVGARMAEQVAPA